MKILYLSTDFGIPVLGQKGAAVHIRELIAAFDRAGHSVMLAAPILQKSPWDRPEPVRASVLHVPLSPAQDTSVLALKGLLEDIGASGGLPGELRRVLYNHDVKAQLSRRFEAHPPDVIYERASVLSAVGVTLAQELNVPLVTELNAPLALEQSTYRSAGFSELAANIERWMLTHTGAVLTVSQALRDYVASLGVPAEKIHVCPNGVDPQRFAPAHVDGTDIRPELRGRGPVLGFVGGLRPWHGVECLPSLLSDLVPTFPDIRLVIAGDGPLRRTLEDEFSARGLESHVVFTGWLSHADVPGLIRQFDVALAPYPVLAHEFYFSPLKVFEYMACGVPVVASNVGQLPDVIQDEVTGLLYPPGDVVGLAKQCRRLLENKELRTRMGEAAARHIHEHYTWDRNAQHAIEVACALIRSQGTTTV